jgi:outer membrane protein assembly factor BamB
VFDVTSLGRGPYGLELRWARLVGSTLYVSNAHRTYAASSRNRNAYLTAVDAGTGAIRWRSPALVANADSFAIVGHVIVTGYGFTAEPDYLFALDRRTGAILARLPVPSAPERIRMTGSTLTVRTYDHVLTVRLSS